MGEIVSREFAQFVEARRLGGVVGYDHGDADLAHDVVGSRNHGHFHDPGMTDQDRFDATRQTIVTADARRYVRAVDEQYDVIVADLFHPARDGSGSLYTLEHFEAVRARLAPDGLFCQWLPLYQLEPEVLKVIVRTFLEAFEETEGFLADFNTRQPVLGLVGRAAALTRGPQWYEERVQDGELFAALDRVALRNGYQVLGCYLGDGPALAAFAGDGPLNLDDRPLVTYLAPRLVYARVAPAQENLRALIGLDREASKLLDVTDPAGAEAAQHLQRYWVARNYYLEGQLAETNDERLELLLASVAASPIFATSYHILLQDVANEASAQPVVARALLDALIRSHPHRPEARQLRSELFGY